MHLGHQIDQFKVRSINKSLEKIYQTHPEMRDSQIFIAIVLFNVNLHWCTSKVQVIVN